MKSEIAGSNKLAFRVATYLFFAVVFLLLVNTNMRKGLSHDEYMYITGGEMLARDGLLPYRDYPYLQMPNLALVYGVLFQATDDLLLAARLLNTMFGVMLLGAVFYTATTLLRAAGNAVRWLVGAGTVLLILFNPLFIYTNGLAMNHDLSVLLSALAVIIYIRKAAGGQSARSWVLCGLLVGLASGTRLSFAVVIAPFSIAILLVPETTWRRKLHLFAMFFMGAILGLLPAIYLATLAPADFLFDNWTYHQFNQSYWQSFGYERAMDIPGKLAYLNDVAVEPGNLALLAAFVLLVVVLGARSFQRKQTGYSPLPFIVTLIVVLLVGALVPTPTWYQYYYVLVPFMALGIVCALGLLYQDGPWRRGSLMLFVVALVVSCIYGVPAYLRLAGDWSIESWVMNEVQKVGSEIGQAVGEGKVATLAPLYPLEGGVRTYKELATGPFEWRVSGFLTGRQKEEHNVLSADSLEAFFNSDPPKGVLVGFEGGLEDPLIQYAMRHEYTPLTLSNGAMLWLRTP